METWTNTCDLFRSSVEGSGFYAALGIRRTLWLGAGPMEAMLGACTGETLGAATTPGRPQPTYVYIISTGYCI